MGRTKKQLIHKRADVKKQKSRSKLNAKALLAIPNHATGENQLARRNSEPCNTLSKLDSNQNCPKGDNLPPDFLGNAAYLLLADKMALGPTLLEAAGLGAISFQEHMETGDGLERLAISQILVTNARVMWLSKLLTEQTNTKAIAIISAAIDSGISTFVRLVRTLDEYRRPRIANTTVSIGQANVAGNQLVQNIQNQEATVKHGNQSKIDLNRAPINAEVVPANTRGITVTPKSHSTNTAVDKKHGATKPRRKGPGGDERS
jgi:hypothetical protein